MNSRIWRLSEFFHCFSLQLLEASSNDRLLHLSCDVFDLREMKIDIYEEYYRLGGNTQQRIHLQFSLISRSIGAIDVLQAAAASDLIDIKFIVNWCCQRQLRDCSFRTCSFANWVREVIQSWKIHWLSLQACVLKPFNLDQKSEVIYCLCCCKIQDFIQSPQETFNLWRRIRRDDCKLQSKVWWDEFTNLWHHRTPWVNGRSANFLYGVNTKWTYEV